MNSVLTHSRYGGVLISVILNTYTYYIVSIAILLTFRGVKKINVLKFGEYGK